jgi:uncharacterized DUF497 family protein
MELVIEAFQWDAAKNAANIRKHGIDFEDAKRIFYEPIMVLESSRNEEKRWVAIGKLDALFVAVIFTMRDKQVRIISARRARRHEERAYRSKEDQ